MTAPEPGTRTGPNTAYVLTDEDVAIVRRLLGYGKVRPASHPGSTDADEAAHEGAA